MRRGASLIAIAAGLCGIALIRKASSDIADAFADSDGRTASLANLCWEKGTGRQTLPTGGGGRKADPSFDCVIARHEKGLSA